jgi:hypothetical protein
MGGGEPVVGGGAWARQVGVGQSEGTHAGGGMGWPGLRDGDLMCITLALQG